MNYSNKNNREKKSNKIIEHMSDSDIILLVVLVTVWVIVSIIFYLTEYNHNDYGPIIAAAWPVSLILIGLKKSFNWLGEALRKIGNNNLLSKLQNKTI